jgi:RNA polymerase sigma factor (sigma-70 family)
MPEMWQNTEELGDEGEAQKELQAEIETELLLKRLTKRQRQCFRLRLNGYKYREIADKLGITTNCATQHIYLARQKIKQNY